LTAERPRPPSPPREPRRSTAWRPATELTGGAPTVKGSLRSGLPGVRLLDACRRRLTTGGSAFPRSTLGRLPTTLAACQLDSVPLLPLAHISLLPQLRRSRPSALLCRIHLLTGGAVTLYSCVRSANGHTFSSLDPKAKASGRSASSPTSMPVSPEVTWPCTAAGFPATTTTSIPPPLARTPKAQLTREFSGYLNTVIIA
jgi:hypothetical protein